MIELVRPMLASPTKPGDLDKLSYPILASPKIDGMRALCRVNPVTKQPELVSRTLKPIANEFTQKLFARWEYVGLDGELVVGQPTDKNLMQQTSSGVNSRDGVPHVKWYVFDKWDMDETYARRASVAKGICNVYMGCGLVWVTHVALRKPSELVALEEKWVNEGYEGMMLRDPTGPYKQNRSTLREGYLLKVKRFEDGEAEVIDVEELQTNTNELEVDERGYAKRSTHKAGKVGAGTLGALIVKDCKTGQEFSIGTGFTAEQRHNLWEGRHYVIGQVAKYKHFAIGVVDKPRFPVFVGFRNRTDM
jgi:DNA ligase-1